MKQKIIFLSLITILLMAISGCGGNSFTYPDASLEKTDGAFVSRTGFVEIDTAEYGADFGTILVSENRNKSNSRLIDLPVVRIRTSSKNPLEPIFCFSGGPGAKNMDWDWKSISYLLSDHDIVIVGYRGVDGSTVLDCPEVEKAFKGEGDLLGEESMKKIGHAWTESAKRLTSQGIDLDGYTIIECTEDFEAVRKALGYVRINLLSASYGTRVAYYYSLKHPESIHRSVMIGANPPGHFGWDPVMIDTQLKRYSVLWAKDSLMSLKSKDLYADMKSVLNTMPRKWFMFSIDPGKVKVVTFCLLFHRHTAAMVFDAYVAAKQGDPSGLALMSFAYNYVLPSMFTWGDLASKAVSADFDSSRHYSREMDSPDRPLGSPMSQLLWGPLKYGRWPTQQLPDEFRHMQYSDVETLLLNGNIDFSTPAENATNEFLPYLKNGKQVIFSECGHVGDVVYLHSENTKHLLTGFYRDGAVDTSMNAYKSMDFHVSWGFPSIAKNCAHNFCSCSRSADHRNSVDCDKGAMNEKSKQTKNYRVLLWMCDLYSEGVIPVNFLKIALNVPFDLKPESNAMLSILYFSFSGSTMRFLNSSTRWPLIKS
jgi:pimeloyl-ACP methyl ester carboxylesterase